MTPTMKPSILGLLLCGIAMTTISWGAKKSSDQVTHGCEHQSTYDDFAFWVGEWDVYSGGAKVAHNSVTRDLSGCLIHEHWHGVSGDTTESMNYYDPVSRAWHEDLVDDSGRVAHYTGGPIGGGAMRMQGISTEADGTVALARATWTPLPEGGLRHLVEHSTDGGKTWTSYFDGTYTKGN